MSGISRDTYEPRNDGIAQNAQRLSQPDAILSGADGPCSNLDRITRGPLAGPTSPFSPNPGTATLDTASRRATGVTGSRRRRSVGWCEAGRAPFTIWVRRSAMSA